MALMKYWDAATSTWKVVSSPVHNHDADYVNEVDHTLAQHTALGLSPDTHEHTSTPYKTPTVLPQDYPEGVTTFYIDGQGMTDGWPVNYATVVTVHPGAAWRVVQTVTQKDSVRTWSRTATGSGDGWTTWTEWAPVGDTNHNHPGEWGDPALSVTGDWNSYTESGIYRGSGLTNQTPFKTHSWQWTLVIKHDPNYVLQIAMDFHYQHSQAGSGAMSMRRLYAGTWQPWTLIGGDDTGWIALPITSPATAYDTNMASWAPRYRRKNGIVYVQGLVNTSTTSTITVATLPAGFRPQGTVMRSQMASGPSTRRMDVASNGAITFREGVGTLSTGWHSLDVQFPVDQ